MRKSESETSGMRSCYRGNIHPPLIQAVHCSMKKLPHVLCSLILVYLMPSYPRIQSREYFHTSSSALLSERDPQQRPG